MKEINSESGKTNISRREFLKLAVLAASSAVLTPLAGCVTPVNETPEKITPTETVIGKTDRPSTPTCEATSVYDINLRPPRASENTQIIGNTETTIPNIEFKPKFKERILENATNIRLLNKNSLGEIIKQVEKESYLSFIQGVENTAKEEGFSGEIGIIEIVDEKNVASSGLTEKGFIPIIIDQKKQGVYVMLGLDAEQKIIPVGSQDEHVYVELSDLSYGNNIGFRYFSDMLGRNDFYYFLSKKEDRWEVKSPWGNSDPVDLEYEGTNRSTNIVDNAKMFFMETYSLESRRENILNSIGDYFDDWADGAYDNLDASRYFVDRNLNPLGFNYYDELNSDEEVGGVKFTLYSTRFLPLLIDTFVKDDVLYSVLGASDDSRKPFVWLGTSFLMDDSEDLHLNRVFTTYLGKETPKLYPENSNYSNINNLKMASILRSKKGSQIMAVSNGVRVDPAMVSKLYTPPLTEKENKLLLQHNDDNAISLIRRRCDGEDVNAPFICSKYENATDLFGNISLNSSPSVRQIALPS